MLDPANVVDTMNRPILVHASDQEFYYCKYNRLSSRAYRLFKEYIITSFLPSWNFISTPVNLIKVRDEHIPNDLGISRKHFAYPCFGLQLVENANELDRHNTSLLTKRRISPTFPQDFLRLSFFDIWTANEDRSHNNYNILLVQKAGRYHLLPIDHEACFNHGELNKPLVPITFEESLIYSGAFSFMFRPNVFNAKGMDELKDKYYICLKTCSSQLQDVLASVPGDWEIDMAYEENTLARFLFNDSWFDEAWASFVSFIHFFINK